MAWPMTLAGLPREGAISKPRDYKQNVQRMKSLLKKTKVNGEQFAFFKPRNQKIQSMHGEQNKRTTTPHGRKLNMNHVTRKKLTGAKLKKAFRMKLFEICKTRTKKSSPDLFNFYLISLGHDMANDASRATTCRRNLKAPWLQTERTIYEGPSEKTKFNGEQFEVFKSKNQKIKSSYGEQNKRTTRPWRQKLSMRACSQEEINWSEIEKSIQNEIVWTLKE